MPSMPSGTDTLRRAALFESLSEAERQALVVCFRPREYRRGEVVFQEGEPGSFLLIVAEGALVATRGRGRRAQELGRIEPGEMAGEMAFFDPAPRSATVTAATPTSAYALDHDAYEVLRHNAPTAADAIMRAAFRVVAGRLGALHDRLQAESER